MEMGGWCDAGKIWRESPVPCGKDLAGEIKKLAGKCLPFIRSMPNALPPIDRSP